MRNKKVYAWFMVIAVVSFLGFCVENIWSLFTRGYMNNRNMFLPFLLGYGLAIFALWILFGTPSQMRILSWKIHTQSLWVRRLLYFLLAMVCVSLGEILLGTAVQKLCHFIWWDYSKIPLHITRYTSLPTSICFAGLILLFMDKVFQPLYDRFLSWNIPVLRVVSVALFLMMTGDFVYHAYLMYSRRSKILRWKISIARSLLFHT